MGKIVIKDGITYYAINCMGCGQELLFKMDNDVRRVYGACRKCMKNFSLEVPKLEKNMKP
ncbi:hypothetical protein EI71_00443 [Anaeroplasma bactoclasticum]|jgi:transcription elongation factor Elf1|uniref:Uncharacterized protein n=1 Tax=Anaeroplasma bactoclasticum TaxID=2088 RepID=A0A397S5Y0_9MOLU|nr:hypothetical protein [Anaeroplasma bactoclasticum]RIA78131.1 hypothetical protein EI71_00443 [Anaeroplasma bactoclasticum]